MASSSSRANGGWLGILKWSLAQSDGTRDASEFKEMAPEDKRWLQEALQSLTVDEAARMRELAAVLLPPAAPAAAGAGADLGAMDGEASEAAEAAAAAAAAAAASAASAEPADAAASVAAKLAALDELSDLVESIDNAKDLFIVGGVAPLLHCVRRAPGADADALRRRAAEVLAVVLANNPRAQAWAREGGMLFLESSAKNADNVKAVFEEVVQRVLESPALLANAQPTSQRQGVVLRNAAKPEAPAKAAGDGCC